VQALIFGVLNLDKAGPEMVPHAKIRD